MSDRLPELLALLAEPDDLARSVVKSVDANTDGQRVTVGLFASAWEIYLGIRALLERVSLRRLACSGERCSTTPRC